MEAGSAGSAHYSVLLNTTKIVWPDGVGPGQALQQKHDTELLHLQVNSSTRAADSNWGAMFVSTSATHGLCSSIALTTMSYSAGMVHRWSVSEPRLAVTAEGHAWPVMAKLLPIVASFAPEPSRPQPRTLVLVKSGVQACRCMGLCYKQSGA